MIDQPQASLLARQAFDLWEAGRAEDAVPLYQKALLLADSQQDWLPQYHSQFAGALSVLGRYAEAGEQYQLALAVQRRQDEDEFTPGVIVARYFLADHFLQQHEPVLALETIEPSLKDGIGSEWLLRFVKALALHATGRTEEAKAEAMRVLDIAPSDEKREELSKLLAEKLAP